MPGNTIFDPPKLITSPVNVSTSGSNVIIPGVPGAVYKIYRMFLVAANQVSVTVDDGNHVDGPLPFLASGAFILDYDTIPWYTSAIGSSITLILGAPVQVSGRLYYTRG